MKQRILTTFLFALYITGYSQCKPICCLPSIELNENYLDQQSMSPKHKLIYYSPISYLEFLRLQNSTEYLEKVPRKQLLLSNYTHLNVRSKTINFYLNISDYDWLRLNRNGSLECSYYDYFLSSPLSHSWYSSRRIGLKPIFYKHTDAAFENTIYSTVCNVKYINASRSPDCMKMLGILGTEHCPVTITFELINQDDIDKFGKTFTVSVHEAEVSSYISKTTLILKKSKFGLVSIVR